MLLTTEDIRSTRQRLMEVFRKGRQYFADASPTKVLEQPATGLRQAWKIELPKARNDAEALRTTIKTLSVDIAGAARGSPLLAEADMQELRHCTRQMLASVRFRQYHHSGVNVHHDEGQVLGVDPPSHEEVPVRDVAAALKRFNEAGSKILDLIDLLSPTDTTQSTSTDSGSYRPNTAFIMMAIDENEPALGACAVETRMR